MLKFATKSAPKDDRLSNAYDAGFRYAEIFLTSKHIDDWKEVATILERYDMSYGLHFPNRPPLKWKQLKKTIKLYQRLKCQSIVIHQPMFRYYSQELLEIDPDVCLAVENHRLNLKSFWHWAESNPGLTLDVEHLWKYTLKDAPFSELKSLLKKFLTQYGTKVKRVHLPGYEPGAKEHRPLSFNPKLGHKVFTALSKIDFQGLIVSETRSTMQKPKYLKNDILMYQNWEKNRLEKIDRR